jgi:hypothetical protein
MNRKAKRERLRRVRRACVWICHASVYSKAWLKWSKQKLLDAWRLSHGLLPSSLANYRYRMTKRHERATGVCVSFGRGTYHRHDVW